MSRLAHPAVRPEWLALHQEPVIDPEAPIIDAHHHLYDRTGARYLAADYFADLDSGHNIIASVLVQARGFYRTSGPETLYPVGETDYAAQTKDVTRCAAIIGHADLTAPDVAQLLDAHLAAGQGLFRGVRHILAWDRDASLLNPAYPTTEDLSATPAFRRGFALLDAMGLSFDAWMHFHQLPRLLALARAFPRVPIVVNHCGGIIGVQAPRDQVFPVWRAAMADLATCPNVTVKLGGLGMALTGFGFDRRAKPPSSADLARAFSPWVGACIDLFGPSRCMAESNFPVDKGSYAYATYWNAIKRLIPPNDRHAVLCATAARVYRIPIGA